MILPLDYQGGVPSLMKRGLSPSSFITPTGTILPTGRIIAAQWDHQEVAEEVAKRIGTSLAVLPGYSGAQKGTDNYFDFIDRLCTRVAEAAATTGKE